MGWVCGPAESKVYSRLVKLYGNTGSCLDSGLSVGLNLILEVELGTPRVVGGKSETV